MWGIRHRRGVVVLNCRADDEVASPVLEVPEWMFDSDVLQISLFPDFRVLYAALKRPSIGPLE